MKKLILLVTFVVCFSLLFTGCTAITNIIDPLPEEYVDGIKVSDVYPDKSLEIYDDAIVFDIDEDDDEITLSYGTEDDIDDVVKFYEELFEDDGLTVDYEDEKDELTAEGKGYGFKFEVNAEEAKGNYEERAFATVIEVNVEYFGSKTLKNLQGFWLACGENGTISDSVRYLGLAIEFDENKMDFYASKEVDTTNIEFIFFDDKTINYTEDGDEYTVDIEFDTIDGIDVLSMSNEGQTINFEKSSYDKMMEYSVVGAETLNNMQGFWLACGVNGELSDAVRIEGTAVEFNDTYLNPYSYFESDGQNIEFSFTDENTIIYMDEGMQTILDVNFETIDGIEVMTLSNSDVKIHFEKSSEIDMLVYADMGGEEGGVILLSDPLTDEELSSIIIGTDWVLTYVSDVDGTWYNAEANETISFTFDYTGVDYYEGQELRFTWLISENILTFSFDTGAVVQFLVDLEFDGENVYLYLFDSELGYESAASVYIVAQ